MSEYLLRRWKSFVFIISFSTFEHTEGNSKKFSSDFNNRRVVRNSFALQLLEISLPRRGMMSKVSSGYPHHPSASFGPTFGDAAFAGRFVSWVNSFVLMVHNCFGRTNSACIRASGVAPVGFEKCVSKSGKVQNLIPCNRLAIATRNCTKKK